MTDPLTPLAAHAALQFAQQAGSLLAAGVEQGGRFAEMLTSAMTDSAADKPLVSSREAVDRLQQLQTQLTERLQAAGVDLGFRIELTASQNGLQLANVHPDHEQIAAVLSEDAELARSFRELQGMLAKLHPEAASQGGLRLQLQRDEFSFDFGG